MLVAIAIVAAAVAFITWGEYTKKARVSGFLSPQGGLIRVHAPQVGMVLERRVADGQAVQRGDVLFVISHDRSAGAAPEAQAAITRQLEVRLESLEEDLEKQRALGGQRQSELHGRLSILRGELAQADSERALQESRVQSARVALRRFEDLKERGFVSDFQVQQKADELLEQRSRLETLKRSRLAVLRTVSSVEAEIRELPVVGNREAAATEREIAAIRQQLTESEARRQAVVTAPQSGTVTSILAEPGHTVSPALPLLAIVPAGSSLEAQLFAPSRAAGFVKPGQRVLLKYQAYPYQKFGQHEGVVTTVSRAALQPGEVPAQVPAMQGQAMYRINVALGSQHVTAYGSPQPLQAGAQLEADIEVERRRIVEWLFEPIISLHGRI
jgi:membrane fusion protein